MKYKVRTLQRALPFYYFLVLFLTFALLVSSFCVYYLKNLRASEYTNLQNLSRTVTSNLSQEVENLSTMSLNAIYSDSIIPKIRELSMNNLSSQDIYLKQQEIYTSIFNVIGLQQNIAQVNVYSVDNIAVGSGLYTFQKNISLEDKDWFQNTASQNGYRYMTSPHPLSYYISPAPFSNDLYYKSLVRLYYNKAHEIDGAVEILQEYSSFFKEATETLLKNKNIGIYILDQNQELIFPRDASIEDALLCQNTFLENSFSSEAVHTIRNTDNKKIAVIQTSIPSVGWNIYIQEPDSVISNSLIPPFLFFILILLLILLLTLGICFIISHRILLPIKKLQHTFELIHLDDLFSPQSEPLSLPNSHYAEINTLIQAFQHMYEKLNHSTTRMLQSKEEEIKAKEIAAQSLMKPHFLYNNLANISIMAEEHMNEEIITLTENLCDYLRYTSAAGTAKVSMKDEFFYTEKYLLCMKVRYKDRLHYSFTLNPSEENIIVPKLILQPLIENALKYAFFRNPPWLLNIACFRKRDYWYISVQDNGCGFDEEVKIQLLDHLEEIRKTRDISQMKIGGMGLSNVYLRLLLMYGEEIHFSITNNQDNGTCITIGGKISNDTESDNL